jgi:hypothetical protein
MEVNRNHGENAERCGGAGMKQDATTDCKGMIIIGLMGHTTAATETERRGVAVLAMAVLEVRCLSRRTLAVVISDSKRRTLTIRVGPGYAAASS